MKVFKCPICEAPRKYKKHCDSKTCTWLYCDRCQHATDPDTNRSIEIKRPRGDSGMLV